jgi:hypothetical protein
VELCEPGDRCAPPGRADAEPGRPAPAVDPEAAPPPVRVVSAWFRPVSTALGITSSEPGSSEAVSASTAQPPLAPACTSAPAAVRSSVLSRARSMWSLPATCPWLYVRPPPMPVRQMISCRAPGLSIDRQLPSRATSRRR